ncbi:hypothetical protein ABX042_11115 [Snodgrassella alvi]|uniref:hypothetical protein n=1 Tax=Snodgrassella alvi TaxID=1196083 RepID=UPI0034609B2E
MNKYSDLPKLINTGLTTVGILCNIIGFMIIIFYCIQIRFYPTGLTLSDALFFWWILLIFGFLYICIISMIYLASFFVIKLFGKLINIILNSFNTNQMYFPKGSNIYTAFGFVMQIYIFLIYSLDKKLFYIIFSIEISMFAVLILKYYMYERINLAENKNTSEKVKVFVPKYFENHKKLFLNIIICIFILPMSLYLLTYISKKIAFKIAGIQYENVTIYTDISYSKFIQNRINTSKIKNKELQSNSINCTDLCNIDSVDILFTNIGSKTLLVIPSGENNEQSLRLELPTSAIKGIEKKVYNSKKD